MALGNSSLVNIAYIKESTFGVIPTSGTPRKLRVTGESLDYSINKEASEEINSSRTTSSMIPLSASASGGLETEVSYLEYDQLLESTLQSIFTPMYVSGKFTATFTTTKITAGTAPTPDLTMFKPSMYFTILGSGTANDGKVFKTHASTASTATEITLDASTPAVAGTGAASAGYIVNLGVSATFTSTFGTTTVGGTAYQSITVSGTGAPIVSTLKKGQFFTVLGSSTSNDGKILRSHTTVTSPAPDSVIILDPNTTVTAGSGSAATTISTSRLVNGSAQTSFTIERQSSDIGEYWAYTGMTPSSMDLSISSGARSTLSFNFMGKGLTRKPSTTNLPAGLLDSKTYDIHSGSTGPSCIIWVDGAPLSGSFVQSLSFTYDNTLREQTAICSLDAIGIGSGTISATGTMEVYFSNGALYDKFASNSNVSLTFSTTDTAGNGYVFSIPKANFSKVSTNAGGKDADLMLSLEFTALNDNGNADAALRNLIQIDRVGAAAV